MPPKEAPVPTPPPLEEIELVEPHEHAGREYPVGARLNLALHGLDHDSAVWLIGLKKAVQVEPSLAAPVAEKEGA